MAGSIRSGRVIDMLTRLMSVSLSPFQYCADVEFPGFGWPWDGCISEARRANSSRVPRPLLEAPRAGEDERDPRPRRRVGSVLA